MKYAKYIKRIRDLREDHDKTQQNIADVLGTSQTMYARYERGATELPVRHLIRLCRYFLTINSHKVKKPAVCNLSTAGFFFEPTTQMGSVQISVFSS